MRALVMLCSLSLAAPDPREWGRLCQKQFEAADASALWPRLSAPMQKLFGGSLEAMKRKLEETRQLNGAAVRTVEEVEQYLPDGYTYARRTIFEKHDVQFIWSFDREGHIVGLLRKALLPDGLAGEAPTRFGDYRTKTWLKLPFKGEWKVFWGGRTVQQNAHASTVDQRFAYDLSRDHSGDGSKNEQYSVFGQPMFAPGAGKVVEAVDGIADNPPGEMNPKQPCGNHVILDHGNGEFSYLCHFQKGSVAVKTGAQVKSGDPLGKCGNSGNSSEPHLHYSLATSPREYQGEGLPAQFNDYLADGKKVARGEPVRGQTISNQ